MCHVLSNELIHQASFSELVIRAGQVTAAHTHNKAWRNIFFFHGWSDFLFVVLTIEQVFIDPPAAIRKEGPAFFCKRFITHLFRHLFSSPKCAKVPESHLRIGSEIFHIHGVVLCPFHHPIHIGIPSSRNPAKLNGFFYVRPETFQHVIIPGKLPVTVHFHYRTHLSVCCSYSGMLCFFKGQHDTKTHQPIFTGSIIEFDITHCFCQFPEQERGSLFIIPDMRAGAVTGTPRIHAPLPSVESSILRPEAGLGSQGAHIEQSGFLYHFRVITLKECCYKFNGFGFKVRQCWVDFSNHIPCIIVPGSIIISHALACPCIPVWEMPGEVIGKHFFCSAIDLTFYRQGCLWGFSHPDLFFGQFTIGAEIIPEVQQVVSPIPGHRRGPVRDPLIIRRSQGNRAPGFIPCFHSF